MTDYPSGTSTALKPATLLLDIVKVHHDGTVKPAVRRYVYCWKKDGDTWESEGIYLTNSNGTLYNVDSWVKEEYNKLKAPSNKSKKEKSPRPRFLCAKGPAVDLPNKLSHPPFIPSSAYEYFFAFFPVELFLRPEFSCHHELLSKWSDSTDTPLLAKPPEHWLKNSELYGTKTFLTSKHLQNGLQVPENFCEILFSLSYILVRMEGYLAYKAARKQPALQTTMLVDTIAEILEGTADCSTLSESTLALARSTSLYHLRTFSDKVRQRYLSPHSLQREQLGASNFSKKLRTIVESDRFNTTFLYYVLSDKHMTGQKVRDLKTGQNKKIPFDPIHFIREERLIELIHSIYAAIMHEPSDIVAHHFYQRHILPAELKLADAVDNEDLKAIGAIFSDQVFVEQFWPNISKNQYTQLQNAIAEGLSSITAEKQLTSLNGEIPGIREKLEKADKKNALWNWLKGSAQKDIDTFLTTCAVVRESWATESFGKNPRLKDSMAKSIKRTVIYARMGIASFKNHQSSGGTTSAAVRRSAVAYLHDVKKRMTDPDRWLKGEDNQLLTSTPTNVKMVFSAIGLIASMQGIYAFAKQSGNNKKPKVDDYINLYKSLSSGVSSVIGLMPDAITHSPLIKALDRVFLPLNTVVDIHASIKFIQKSQLYFSQGETKEALFQTIQAGIKMASAGFSLLSLARASYVRKLLLRKEIIAQYGARSLGAPLICATVGCELMKWYLKSIEPEGSKVTKKIVVNLLDENINNDPRKQLKRIKIDVNGIEHNVEKVNAFDPALSWKLPSNTEEEKHAGEKEEEKYVGDKEEEWSWLELRKLLMGEKTLVYPIEGLGWVGWHEKLDTEKVMFELLNRGVSVKLTADVCKMKEEEVERRYKNSVKKNNNDLNSIRTTAGNKGNLLSKIFTY